jgi:hypothetical protein
MQLTFALYAAGEYDVGVTVAGTTLVRALVVVPGITHTRGVGATMMVGGGNGAAPLHTFSAAGASPSLVCSVALSGC